MAFLDDHPRWVGHVVLYLLLASTWIGANGQAGVHANRALVSLTVVDENGVPVEGAQITLSQPRHPPLRVQTNYAGRCAYSVSPAAPYDLHVEKHGFYVTLERQVDPQQKSLELTLSHQQIVRQEVDVVASPTSGIDPQQTSDVSTMSTPEVVNIPYRTSRDIRNLLLFNPGVIQDGFGQAHVAGSDTFATLDLLDGFDIRSPASGNLALRVSTDAVRSIDVEKTRYPVEYGKATGGVISFRTGMGDNKFRFNTTDFLPSFREINGLHFDKFAPRVTFSGPLKRNQAWYFNGFEMEYDNLFISGLPANADSGQVWRESNLTKGQVNLTPNNFLIGGVLFNNYHSPYEGLSTLIPRESTIKRDTIAWLPYLRDQHAFAGGALLDVGAAWLHIRDAREPHGITPFEITPELSQGSYFENRTDRARRAEETAALYLPPRRWAGRHDFKAGLDLDQISFGQEYFRAPINYLREDGTLLRRSTFPAQAPYTRGNSEVGAYFEDHWLAARGLVVEPGIRFDWDEIVRRPLYSPRLAMSYTPSAEATTKFSAGAGLYYEHTQLRYLEESFAGLRTDTYYAADGVTPLGPSLATAFTVDYSSLRAPRVFNWSAGIERKLPASVYASLNYLDKRGTDGLVYLNQGSPGALSGTYLLTNARHYDYRSVDFSLKRSFLGEYTLFGSYTRSFAHTNAALDYSPTLSVLGPQQGGPSGWDVPNRVISWGWLPVPKFKSWGFVYTVDWRTGFPFTSINANQQVVGTPGSRRYPNYVSWSPGLEWKFHFRGSYFGLRGVLENATDSQNPSIVNNVVDSPQYGVFSEPQGRALTARIRLISSK